MKTNKILINTSDGKYPILIGNNLSLKLGNLLKKNNILSTKILLVIDTKVPRKIVQKIKNKLKKKNFSNLYKFQREKQIAEYSR